MDKDNILEIVNENNIVSLSLDDENLFYDEINPNQKVSNPGDGLILSLNNLGRVDINYISSITNLPKEEIINSLKGSIFLDPQQWNRLDFEQGWVTKDEYLSGHLSQKYDKAVEFNKMYPHLFKENIEAIEEVIPKKIPLGEIFITLGSPWIPENFIKDFVTEVLNFRYNIMVKHNVETGSWQIIHTDEYNVASNQIYGTSSMSAADLLEKTLNLLPIEKKKKIRVYSPEKNNIVIKEIVDEDETNYLLEKQKLLNQVFVDWIKKDPIKVKELEKIYFSLFGSVKKRQFDGSFLTFPKMNKGIILRKYQLDAIAQIIFSPNVLLAHDVGSGKTFIMIAAGQKMKSMGMAKKIMYVVPNNIVSQWENIYLNIFPKANILVVNNKNFNTHKRKETLKLIRDNDYDAIIITYSCFELIKLSKNFYQNKYQKLLNTIKESSKDEERRTKFADHLYREISKKKEKFDLEAEKDYQKYGSNIYFEDLNIDHLLVDEAHNFKNVPFFTKLNNVLGINPLGSKKCDEMMDKIHYIQQQHNGKGVVLATGTPITNSISDAYVLQQYLQSGDLKILRIDNFDSWVMMFSEITKSYEIDVTTDSFRKVNRFKKFHNLPELASLLGNISDFYHVENPQSIPQFDGYTDVMVNKSQELSDYLLDLSTRADEIRNHHARTFTNKKGEEKRDNMLLVTTDGRKGALDLRLIDENKYSFNYESKIYKCAKNVFDIYFKYDNIKATQLIFCDISTPKSTFNVYDELKNILVTMGIPKDEIKFIHDAANDIKRNELFLEMRQGKIRILIGSTFKLGTGVNVQDRLIAIHHLDVPWRPSDMVQREGRILREGNMNKKVFIYRYITQGTFDAYSWQLLETKQEFISQIINDDITIRDADDVDDTVLTYAEVKALAIGNPLIKTRVETANELRRYQSLERKYKEKRENLIVLIQKFKLDINELSDKINNVNLDIEYYKSLNLEDENKEEKVKIGEKIIDGFKKLLIDNLAINIGDYLGFSIRILPSIKKRLIEVKRKSSYIIEIGSSPVGAVTRIDNLFNKLETYRLDLEKKLFEKQNFVRDGQEELLHKITYQKQIDDLKEKLDEIDRELGVKDGKEDN